MLQIVYNFVNILNAKTGIPNFKLLGQCSKVNSLCEDVSGIRDGIFDHFFNLIMILSSIKCVSPPSITLDFELYIVH